MIGLLSTWRRRLAWKWLWLRHSYPFHFAHKPLCEQFRHDVLHVGPVHVCRSCTLAYAGIAAGGLLCGLVHGPLQEVGARLFFALAAVTLALSFPPWYKTYWPRPMRDVLRFALGLVIALCGYLAVSGQLTAGLAGVVLLATMWKVYGVLRGRQKDRACDRCPELTAEGICAGFALQADRIRQYEEAATEMLLASGDVPEIVPSRNR